MRIRCDARRAVKLVDIRAFFVEVQATTLAGAIREDDDIPCAPWSNDSFTPRGPIAPRLGRA